MYKKIFFTVAHLILVVGVSASARATESATRHLNRAKELLNFERWEDARFELLQAKHKLNNVNTSINEEIERCLIICAVELQRDYVSLKIVEFEEQYKPTLRDNNVTFFKAIEAFNRKDYDAAKSGFESLDYSDLTADEVQRADIRMAYISFKSGDYNETKRYTSRISKVSDVRDHARYYDSYIAYVNGDLDSAKEGFKTLTSSNTYGNIAPIYLLQIESQQGNYQYVVENSEKILSRATDPQKGDILITLSEAHFKRNEFNKVVEYLAIYTAHGGTMGRNENYMLGFSKYQLGQLTEAQQPLREACGADDEMTQNASFHLADCYLKAGDKRQAMYSFAMASNEQFNAEIAEDALFNYGKLQYELGGGRFNEAINILTRYIERYPENKRAYEVKKLLIAAYYNSDNYDAAYKAIKEVKNPDAEIRSALQKIAYFRGLEAFQSGDFTLARQCLEESAAVDVSVKYSALARFWIGEIDYLDGDFSAALKNYNIYLSRAPKGDPTYSMALYSTAYALLKLELMGESLQYFKRYLTQQKADTPMVADANNRIGDILYGQRNFTNATQSYKIAERSQSAQKYYAQYQIALIDGIQSRNSNKIKRLENIVTVDKGDYVEDAMYELGRTNISQENYRQAVLVLERFIVKYPHSQMQPRALSDLGLAYLNLGDKKTSIKYYDRAIKSAPQSSVSKDAIQGIREIYVDQGDAKGYFQYAEKMGLESDLNAVAKDSLSFASAQRIYLAGEDISKATKSLSDYISDYPSGYYLSDALFLVSDCYLKSDKKPEAISSLSKLAERGANQYSERVYDRLSSLTLSEKMYKESAEAYRKLYDIAKETTKKELAMEGYVDATIKIDDDETTIKMADDVLKHADSGAKAIVKAKYAKATILRERGEWNEATKLYADLSKEPTTAMGAEASYYIISDAYRRGKGKDAEALILKFAETQTNQAYWLAKAFLLLGDIYVDRSDAFQARATYQSIVDGYDNAKDGIIEEAKGKIERLQE